MDENTNGTAPAGHPEAQTAAGDPKDASAGAKTGGQEKDPKQAAAPGRYDEAYVENLRARMAAERDAAVKAAKEEAAKLAAMPDDQKADYEKAQREKALAEREAAILKRELTADAKALLAKSGLPDSFTGMVLGADARTTEENIKSLKAAFDEAVQAQVETRIKGTTPGTGTGNSRQSEEDAIAAEIAKYFD